MHPISIWSLLILWSNSRFHSFSVGPPHGLLNAYGNDFDRRFVHGAAANHVSQWSDTNATHLTTRHRITQWVLLCSLRTFYEGGGWSLFPYRYRLPNHDSVDIEMEYTHSHWLLWLINLSHQMEHFLNPLDLYHASIWWRAHMKHMWRERPFKKKQTKTEGDWMTNQIFNCQFTQVAADFLSL